MAERFSTPKDLQVALDRFIDHHGLRGDAKWYTRREWLERGEKYGVAAILTLAIDGSPLYDLLNLMEAPSLHAKLDEVVSRHGWYYELGYAWSVHFYPGE